MAQTLQTNIVINARTGNGFSEVGNTLAELGSIVNDISQQLISFGVDSANVYRDYQKSMKDAEVALATDYGRGTKELQDVMNGLNAAATEWAATTIFHTNDVANAISEAAHAGWDYEQIMTGIPAAMQLAQAGSIDLSEAVNYIVKATNAAGIEFDDTASFIDHWAFAANTSATTIDEMGQAMLKMGRTMQFAGGTDELLVMLAELANAGTTGATAGTLLRNSMLRLIAPTKNAKEAMASLGAESDEVEEILSDEALAAANARLAAAGFSAYDENGDLKSMLDTYQDLYLALGNIAGGYDKITTNEEALDIISTIFPMRSITGALTFLEAAGENYHSLYDYLTEGEAEGYGAYAAETMMDSLYGSLELFDSKVERLKQVFGEELSDDIQSALEGLGGIVDSIAGLDDASLNALVSGLEIIAAAGPALLIAAGAFRLLGMIANPAGIGMAAIIGTAAVLAYVDAIDQANFEDKFGELTIGTGTAKEYIAELSEEFNQSQVNISKYYTALDTAVESYKTASSEFKSDLLTAALTESTLSEEQIEKLNGLGESIISAVQTGIESNYAGMTQSIIDAFTGSEEGAEDNPILDQIISVLDLGYQAEIAHAEELSQQLRDAMTSAFSDGHLTSEEVSNIQNIIDEQNELLAQQQDREHYLERQRMFRKAQTLGLEGIQEVSALAEEERNAEWETLMDQQAGAYYDVATWYDRAIENGWMIPNADGSGGEHKARPADKAAALSVLEEEQTRTRYAYGADFNRFLGDLWTEGITGSELSDAWSALQDLAYSYRAAGGIITPEAQRTFNGAVSAQDATDVSKYLGRMVEALGGYDVLSGYADYYNNLGDTTSAFWYKTMMDMYDVLGGGLVTNPEAGTRGNGTYDYGSYNQMEALLQGYGTYTPEELVDVMNREMGLALENGFSVDWDSVWHGALGEGLYNEMTTSAANAGFGSITDWVSQIGDEIASLDDQNLIENIDANPEEAQAKISALDGQNVTIYIDANASAAYSKLNQFKSAANSTRITAAFAEGGRAVTASIFAEDGPEWAIPEEHSERTAQLLNSARLASGFSWAELLARTGGLNADPSGKRTTIVFSPTINAGDVTGVDQALRMSEERLLKMLEEQDMINTLEVYS